MRILKSHPLLKLVNSYLIDASQPSNISYLWNFGSLLLLCLVIQIITGVTLAMKFGLCVATKSYKLLEHPLKGQSAGKQLIKLNLQRLEVRHMIINLLSYDGIVQPLKRVRTNPPKTPASLRGFKGGTRATHARPPAGRPTIFILFTHSLF